MHSESLLSIPALCAELNAIITQVTCSSEQNFYSCNGETIIYRVQMFERASSVYGECINCLLWDFFYYAESRLSNRNLCALGIAHIVQQQWLFA